MVIWPPVHFILTPNTINTCHMYTNLLFFIGFCVFCSLDWFWDGRTSNTNILCLVIVSLANLPKKSPCHGKDHKTDGNTLRTHQASSLLINVMPQEHWDPQRMCFGWVMTINDGQCLIKNRVVVTNERTLLNTMLQLIQTFFINKDKWFRIVEEVIPLLGSHEHQNNSLGSSAPVQNSYIL
jgi:hypothetical protein